MKALLLCLVLTGCSLDGILGRSPSESKAAADSAACAALHVRLVPADAKGDTLLDNNPAKAFYPSGTATFRSASCAKDTTKH